MKHQNRRTFIKNSIITGSAMALNNPFSMLGNSGSQSLKEIQIKKVDSNFEREPLIRPFGFKGGYMSEIWQTVSYLESSSGNHQIGCVYSKCIVVRCKCFFHKFRSCRKYFNVCCY